MNITGAAAVTQTCPHGILDTRNILGYNIIGLWVFLPPPPPSVKWKDHAICVCVCGRECHPLTATIQYFYNKKKGELVMNEVFTKRLCVEAKKSQWNVMSATLNPALTALKVMTREKCVWVKKWKIGELCMFFVRCQWKRGADSKKTKKLGNRIKSTTFCLREILDDLVIWYSHPCFVYVFSWI